LMNRILSALFAVGVLASACGGDEEEPAIDAGPDAMPPTGTISLSWVISEGGAPSDCQTAGVQLVSMALVRQGEGAGETDVFTCTAGEATTRQLRVGTYNLSLDLVSSTGDRLLPEPLEMNGIVVSDGGNQDLGQITFEL